MCVCSQSRPGNARRRSLRAGSHALRRFSRSCGQGMLVTDNTSIEPNPYFSSPPVPPTARILSARSSQRQEKRLWNWRATSDKSRLQGMVVCTCLQPILAARLLRTSMRQRPAMRTKARPVKMGNVRSGSVKAGNLPFIECRVRKGTELTAR